ncbi:unnamed protein product [Rotaria sordida]|uniref:Uncharacterized protein n=1 Tax=Rotaria sordida TaxID=392033 RepID=A0A815ISU8_9BILA|nr:unnamed protein product [Rotaria sordida]CAF1353631.1 unnamed protein product [Rotaria sordida]CAF1369675.1 unnamed protein product [Rotaria sordida]CAF3924651.1 unnamed protein product [Rotaria sordida]CAF4093741.1 unnamed protein product [Rotaria sordida]
MANIPLTNGIDANIRQEAGLSTPISIDILNPSDAMRYIQEVTNEANLFTSVKEAVTLTHDFLKGLHEAEFQELIEDTEEPYLRTLLQKVLDLREGEMTLLASTREEKNHSRLSWVVKGERMKNGKFDIVQVNACQVKEIDKQKIAAYSLAAASLGCVIGAVANPVVGMITGSAALAAGGLKTAFDVKKCPRDVIYGYILKYLQDKNLLNISNSNTDNRM